MRVLSDVLGIVATVLAVDWLLSDRRRAPAPPPAPAVSCRACDPDRLWHGGQVAA